jgi:hypothetical protein
MDNFPPPPSTQDYALRNADKADLDDITRIHIDGFVAEPMDNYCYPRRFRYPEDHFKWMKKEYEYYLDNPQKYLVHVAEAPAEAGSAPKPMALAVWNISVLAQAFPLGQSASHPEPCFRLAKPASDRSWPRPAERCHQEARRGIRDGGREALQARWILPQVG